MGLQESMGQHGKKDAAIRKKHISTESLSMNVPKKLFGSAITGVFLSALVVTFPLGFSYARWLGFLFFSHVFGLDFNGHTSAERKFTP